MPIATCEQCGNPFEARDRTDRSTPPRFCSRNCFFEHGRQEAERRLLTFTCQYEPCGKTFPYKPQYLAAYRRKHGKDPQFCSSICAGLARKGHQKPPLAENTCKNCGKLFPVRRQRELSQAYCSKDCMTTYESTYGRLAAQVPRKPHEHFSCKECGEAFSYTGASVIEYRKKHGHDPLYCSTRCSDLGRRKDSDERHKTVCKNCGEPFYRTRTKGSGAIYRSQMLCSRQCQNQWVTKVYREKHGPPLITKRMRRGYVLLHIPASDDNPIKRDVLEHRYVMEQFLGRSLFPGETVHHRSGDKTDNRLENLQLFAHNHGPGQEVEHLVAWCCDMEERYSEFFRRERTKRRKSSKPATPDGQLVLFSD